MTCSSRSFSYQSYPVLPWTRDTTHTKKFAIFYRVTSKYYIHGFSLRHTNGTKSELMLLTRPEPSHEEDVQHIMRCGLFFFYVGVRFKRHGHSLPLDGGRMTDLVMRVVLPVQHRTTLGTDLAHQSRIAMGSPFRDIVTRGTQLS
jgi:hypothetical protein